VIDSAHRKNDGDRPAIEKEENTKRISLSNPTPVRAR
jgi:hypothetical protein